MSKIKDKVVCKFTLRLNQGNFNQLKKVKLALNVKTHSKGVTEGLNELLFYMEENRKLSEENKKLYYDNEKLKADLAEYTGEGNSGEPDRGELNQVTSNNENNTHENSGSGNFANDPDI